MIDQSATLSGNLLTHWAARTHAHMYLSRKTRRRRRHRRRRRRRFSSQAKPVVVAQPKQP